MSFVPVIKPELLGDSVTADRTEPGSDSGFLGDGHGVQFFKTVWEALVESPQAVEIIPAIVPDKGINVDAAFFIEFFVPCVHDIDTLLLGHAL